MTPDEAREHMMTDEEIINAALLHYANFLGDASTAVAQKTFRLPSGKEPTSWQVSEMIRVARRAGELWMERSK